MFADHQATQPVNFSFSFCFILLLQFTRQSHGEMFHLYWNSSNSRISERSENAQTFVSIRDRIVIHCPHYDDQKTLDQTEQSIMYMVSKEGYDSCRINAGAERPNSMESLPIGVCRSPFQPVSFTMVIRQFSPNPMAPEFHPEQTYYFIATTIRSDKSTQLKNELCQRKNLRISFTVRPERKKPASIEYKWNDYDSFLESTRVRPPKPPASTMATASSVNRTTSQPTTTTTILNLASYQKSSFPSSKSAKIASQTRAIMTPTPNAKTTTTPDVATSTATERSISTTRIDLSLFKEKLALENEQRRRSKTTFHSRARGSPPGSWWNPPSAPDYKPTLSSLSLTPIATSATTATRQHHNHQIEFIDDVPKFIKPRQPSKTFEKKGSRQNHRLLPPQIYEISEVNEIDDNNRNNENEMMSKHQIVYWNDSPSSHLGPNDIFIDEAVVSLEQRGWTQHEIDQEYYQNGSSSSSKLISQNNYSRLLIVYSGCLIALIRSLI